MSFCFNFIKEDEKVEEESSRKIEDILPGREYLAKFRISLNILIGNNIQEFVVREIASNHIKQLVARERRFICRQYNGTIVEPTAVQHRNISCENDCSEDESITSSEDGADAPDDSCEDSDGAETSLLDFAGGGDAATSGEASTSRAAVAGDEVGNDGDASSDDDDVVDEVLPCTVDTCEIPRGYGINDNGDMKSAITVANKQGAGGGGNKGKDDASCALDAEGSGNTNIDEASSQGDDSSKSKHKNNIAVNLDCDSDTDSDEDGPYGATVAIRHVNGKMVEMVLLQKEENTKLTTALEQRSSDLVPQIYEGGLKIWECSLDLSEYLMREPSTDFIKNKTVLELGCGSAIPSICCGLLGAKQIHLQDYNIEVLQHVTTTNFNLNRGLMEYDIELRYFSGDWSTLVDLVGGVRYDLILTAETIYNKDVCNILHDTMASLLKPNGVIYLAAKVIYFGVGGGLRDFENLMMKKDVFKFETVKKYEKGVKREILRISFKNKQKSM